MPKNSTNGARYANVGMICITSRIGVMVARARSFRATRMPIGTPIRNEIATAADTAASVSTPEFHRPSTPIARSPRAAPAASRIPPTARPSTPAAITSAGQPIAFSELVSVVTSVSMTTRGTPNSNAKIGLLRLSRMKSRTSLSHRKNGRSSARGWMIVPWKIT